MPNIPIKWSDNTEELRKNLIAGMNTIEATRASVDKLVQSFQGDRLSASAQKWALAINQIGGATKLTAAEQDRANAVFDKFIEKQTALGRAVPEAVTALNDEIKALRDARAAGDALGHSTTAWSSTIAVGVASGQLLAAGMERVASMVESAAEALPHMVEGTMKLGGELLTTSLKTGISVESLSALRYVAAQVGTDLGSLTNAIFKMSANLGAVGDESKKVQDAIGRLGLNLQTLKNEAPDQAFTDILEKLHDIPNAADRAGVGMALFGKGWKEVAQLASEDVKGLIEEAQRLGIVMSTETAAAAKAADDSLTLLRFQIEGLTNRIGAAFLPAVIGIAHDLSGLFAASVTTANDALDGMGRSGGFLDTARKAMGSGSEAIAAQTELYYQLRDAVNALIRGGIEPLISGVGFIGQEWNALLVINESVANGFQAITFGVEELIVALLKLQKYTDPAAFGIGRLLDAAAAAVEKDRDRLYNSMAQGQANIERLKKSEQDWAATSSQLNAQIEAGLNRIKDGHVDIAKVIQDVAQMSRAATVTAASSFETLSADAKKASEDYAKALDAELQGFGRMATAAQAAVGKAADSMLRDMQRFIAALKDPDSDPRTILVKGWSETSAAVMKATALVSDYTLAQRAAQAAEQQVAANGAKGIAQLGAQLKIAATQARTLTDTLSSLAHLDFSQVLKDLGNIGKVDLSNIGKGFLQNIGQGLEQKAEQLLENLGKKIWSGIKQLFGAPSQKELDARGIESAFEQSFGGFDQMMQAVGKAYLATGKTLEQAKADVKALLDAEKQGPEATQKWIDKINQTIDTQKKLDELRISGTNDAATGLTTFLTTSTTAASKVADLQKQIADVQAQRATASGDQAKNLDAQLASLQKQLQTQQALQQMTGVNSDAQATAFAGALTSTFDQLQKNGVPITEAVKQVGPAVDALHDQLMRLGEGGGQAFDELYADVHLAEDEIGGPALNAVQGIGQALIGMRNNGRLTQDMFAGMASKVTEVRNGLIAQGKDGDAALRDMQPTLQTLWEMEQDFGYKVDDGTQALIDQAHQQGIVGEQMRSTEQQTLDVLKAIAKALGADIPDAARRGAAGVNDALDNIKDPTVTVHYRTDGQIPDRSASTGWNDFPQSGAPDLVPVAAATGGIIDSPGKLIPFARYMRTGGLVPEQADYFAAGRLVQFVPRGTDTVPAMLTPRELVVNEIQTGTIGHTLEQANSLAQLATSIFGASASGSDEVVAQLQAINDALMSGRNVSVQVDGETLVRAEQRVLDRSGQLRRQHQEILGISA